MIDNFTVIKPLLEFPHKEAFYFVQILQRKKEHPGKRLGGSNNNSRVIRTYYIESLEKYDIHKEEMIKLCEVFNARASINLNPRNFEKTAFHTMVKMANQMANKNFPDVAKAYNSVCGEYQSEIDKRWIIDIDTQDLETVQKIKMTIQALQKEILNREYKILALIPSKSGYHIITQPFNEDSFKRIYPDIEIHRNNPTNLYIP